MGAFASRLKQVRTDKGLRQRELAEALGLAQSTIANYEQDVRFPDEQTLARIADLFDVSLDFLLGREERPRGNDSGTEPAAYAASPGANETLPSPPAQLGQAAQAYLDALLGAGRSGARAVVDQTIARTGDIRDVYLQVFAPALREVGRQWQAGRVDVFQEHHISEATQLFMSQLMAGVRPRKRRRGFVGAVVGGDEHDIGMRMVSDFLALEGWEVLFLGTNVPTPSLLRALRSSHAQVLGLSCTMRSSVNTARDVIAAIRSEKDLEHIGIMVGGSPFVHDPSLCSATGADGSAADARGAAELAERLAARHGRPAKRRPDSSDRS